MRPALAALTFALGLAAFGPTGPLLAQGTGVSLGAINADPNAPVEISAESFSVDQSNGSAVFSGKVVIGQGDLRLAAGRVEVRYRQEGGDISRLVASEGVTFVTPSEEAEAAAATYDLDGRSLVLTGKVLLIQGQTALSGDRLDVDLTTGKARMSGNVRAVLGAGQ